MPKKTTSSYLILALLILSGEVIFLLPFVLPRVFGTTMLEAFSLSNTELGECFSIYGLVAFASYFFGGPLADRYSTKHLLSGALFLTSLGGVIMAVFPDITVLKWIYGYWGFTTIFLFWAAMIKATRIWGGDQSQGTAFGLLDGGRGLVAAIIGSAMVALFSFVAGTEPNRPQQTQESFVAVIWISSAVVAGTGLLLLLFMKNANAPQAYQKKININDILSVLRLRNVWLLMSIVLCAYVGYKTTDFLPQYANEIMGYNQIDSAQLGASLLYLRPVAGILAGLLADRTRVSLWIVASFLIMALFAGAFALGILTLSHNILFLISSMFLALGVYAGRALYFAVMKEAGIGIEITGMVVGIVSVVGFTPDIFMGPLSGYFLDNFSGIQGFQYLFAALTGFSVLGGISSLLLYVQGRKGQIRR